MTAIKNNMASVFIIILNYNGIKDTLELLDNIVKLDYSNYKIIVIDNASSDGSNLELKKITNIDLIENNKNLGFVGGNNIGIKFALKQKADYILLLNNDTIVESDFLAKLVNAMESDSGIGLTGSKIMNYNDRQKIWSAGGGIKKWSKKTFQYGEGKIDDGSYDEPKEVDFLSGCCLLIRREVIEKIGLLDDDYFMYYEDVDYCLKAKRAGFKVFYVPQSVIWHKVANSSSRSFRDFYRMRNYILYMNKNFRFTDLRILFVCIPTITERILRIFARKIKHKDTEKIHIRIHSLFKGVVSAYKIMSINRKC